MFSQSDTYDANAGFRVQRQQEPSSSSQDEKEEDGLLGMGLLQLQCFGHDTGSRPLSCLSNAEMRDLRGSQAGALEVVAANCSPPHESRHQRLLDQATFDGIALMQIQPRFITLSESLQTQILLEPYLEYGFSCPSSPLPQPSTIHSGLPSVALKRKLPPVRDLSRHSFHMRPSK
ncbi:hypothetical protein L207DRAFT_508319 [Hyaloscypha variabilis F]|uniref:Uncharacterized protein n=1 Tax=Hyaloscypha variabilis (strain UAMH 11265 / GT02V1 / F) TaxID=1149755 RepID=A0A2J6S3S9_HYAVF|nr:hypothetical protein L207DRAFT_508319 [Hyaloscypha variabilis F]